ncbi:cupin domain-containing protein [Massilia sp. CCM 8695]|uniref:Cupin domain-containing protein n=1 Tax=Massilia frigida TaxID=2609281 RepID=A0ABX0N7N4_9BURK|nr:cupin domain-containing protein [Massilia frigida]NHZ81407.1 cupin domain-containing protein [Massilia frigida]
MRIVRGKDYTGSRAWEAQLIAAMQDATVRLHWTDQPYPWHVNDGEEVFAVLDGEVTMHYREAGRELAAHLRAGDIFHAAAGDAHSAHPQGQARILVIERAGSV